jgi:hypothetical protein
VINVALNNTSLKCVYFIQIENSEIPTVYTRTVAKIFCYLEGWLDSSVGIDLIVIQFIEKYSRITAKHRVQGTEFYTHEYLVLSLYIIFTCLNTSFLAQRDHTFLVW